MNGGLVQQKSAVIASVWINKTQRKENTKIRNFTKQYSHLIAGEFHGFYFYILAKALPRARRAK